MSVLNWMGDCKSRIEDCWSAERGVIQHNQPVGAGVEYRRAIAAQGVAIIQRK
jgi:hypothetical protein